jgi:hypothetical protein
MALLVGRDDIAAFTNNQFLGFGGGNYNLIPRTAASGGNGTILNTAIENFSGATDIRYNVYEQTAGAGDLNLVRSIDVLAAASPQSTAISPALVINAGSDYFIAAHSQNQVNDDFWQSLSDPSIVTPYGVGSAGIAETPYSSPQDPLVIIGRESDGEIYWNIDDGAAASDTIPDQFTFTDQTNVAISTGVQSNSVTVSGINSASAISITNGSYSVGGGAFTTASGTIENGQSVVVLGTSSASNNTATNTVLTIGTVSDTFSLTTVSGVAKSVDSVTGTIAPGQVIVVNVTGFDAAPAIQTATLGGQSLTVNSWSATAPNLTIPTDINLDWGGSYPLVLIDDTGQATLAGQVLVARSGWEFVTYDGTALDFASSESFAELISNDFAVSLIAGDQVRWETVAGFSVSANSTVVTPEPPIANNLYQYSNGGLTSGEISFGTDDFVNATTTLFTFTGADGSPPPSPLIELAGSFEIQNNTLVATGVSPDPSEAYAWLIGAETSLSDGTVSATYNSLGSAGGESGLVFRFADVFNFFDLIPTGAGGNLILFDIVASGATPIGNYTIPGYDSNTDYEVSIAFSGSSIVVTVNGIEAINVTSSSRQSATIHGLKIGDPVSSFDNLRLPGILVPVTSVSGTQNVTIQEGTVFSETYTISGPVGATALSGADAAVFTFVDSGASATLSLSSFDFEAPQDVGTNNVYNVTVSNNGVDYPVEITVTDDGVGVPDTTAPTLTGIAVPGGNIEPQATFQFSFTSNEAGSVYWEVTDSATPTSPPFTNSQAMVVGLNTVNANSGLETNTHLHFYAEDNA